MNRETLFRRKRLTFAAAVLAISGSVLIAGCGTIGGTSTGVSTSAGDAFDSIREGAVISSKNAEKVTITKGMTKAEIAALMGDPTEIKHVFRNGAVGEVWTYERIIYEGVRADGPGELLEESSTSATTELLFSEGMLVAFKEDLQEGISRVVMR